MTPGDPLRSCLRVSAMLVSLLFALPVAWAAPAAAKDGPPQASPLVIGQTFTVESAVLGETRRINVYRPSAWNLSPEQPLPVLYMPDGGMGEDFLHVAGLLQVLTANGSMRPFLLVGIENTERRRDMTGPTSVPEDRKIAPRVGGSAAFRRFLSEELIPQIRRRYPVTAERAIIGESLAGLFVVETLLQAPDMFDAYIALDPSLWWNNRGLINDAAKPFTVQSARHKRVFLASSGERRMAADAQRLSGALQAADPGIGVTYRAWPDESHATIYHPAALDALRTLFKPAP